MACHEQFSQLSSHSEKASKGQTQTEVVSQDQGPFPKHGPEMSPKFLAVLVYISDWAVARIERSRYRQDIGDVFCRRRFFVGAFFALQWSDRQLGAEIHKVLLILPVYTLSQALSEIDIVNDADHQF